MSAQVSAQPRRKSFSKGSSQSSAAATGLGPQPAGATNIVASRYKTKLCEKWAATGTCPYENRCMFAHGEHELRTKAMNLAEGITSEDAIKAHRRDTQPANNSPRRGNKHKKHQSQLHQTQEQQEAIQAEIAGTVQQLFSQHHQQQQQQQQLCLDPQMGPLCEILPDPCSGNATPKTPGLPGFVRVGGNPHPRKVLEDPNNMSQSSSMDVLGGSTSFGSFAAATSSLNSNAPPFNSGGGNFPNACMATLEGCVEHDSSSRSDSSHCISAFSTPPVTVKVGGTAVPPISEAMRSTIQPGGKRYAPNTPPRATAAAERSPWWDNASSRAPHTAHVRRLTPQELRGGYYVHTPYAKWEYNPDCTCSECQTHRAK